MTYKLKDKCKQILAEFENFKVSKEDSKYNGFFISRVFDMNYSFNLLAKKMILIIKTLNSNYQFN